MSNPPARKALLLAEWLLFLAVAVGALAFHLTLPARLPSEADHQAAAAHLAQHAQAGDKVLLFPWWLERARLFLPAGLPVISHPAAYDDDVEEARRIWVYAAPGLPKLDARDFAARFGAGRQALGPPSRFGALELTLFENGRFRPALFSASDSVKEAEVFLESANGQRQSCPFDGKAFRCPDGNRVAAEWHEVFYEPRRCLWMNPPGGPRKLVARFPTVPAGELRLGAGIIWEWAVNQSPGVTPLHAGVTVEGDSSARLEVVIPPGEEGMHFSSNHLASGSAVSVWVSSDSPTVRSTCVELKSLGAR